MEKVKPRLLKLVEAIEASKSGFKNDELAMTEQMIRDCGRYIDKVTTMEAALCSARFRLEPADFRQLVMDLDRSRKLAHDALNASVGIITRLCRKYDVPLVYDGPEDRIAIAEFAQQVVNEFFDERRL